MAVDIEKLKDSDYLVDLLVQMEDVLDSLDIYVFEHWIDGEIVEGPTVRRHWVSFCLLYPRRKMPDPRAALRLLKHGVKVEFSRVYRKESKKHSEHMDSDGTSSPVGSTKRSQDAASPMAWSPGSPNDEQDDPKLARPSKKKSDMHWLVEVTFPRRLLDQLEAADASAYDDDVDADDVSDAKDDGLDDESAYNSDEQNPESEGAMPQGSPMDDPMSDPMSGGMPPQGGQNGF